MTVKNIYGIHRPDKFVITTCNSEKSFYGNRFDDEVTLIDGVTCAYYDTFWSFMLFKRNNHVWVAVIGKIQYRPLVQAWKVMPADMMRRIVDKLLSHHPYKRSAPRCAQQYTSDPSMWIFYYDVSSDAITSTER